jgi:hypothetical protein
MQQTLSIQAYWIHFLGLGLLAFLTGMVLIYLAKRGKRQGDNPFCARCHYDLLGMTESTQTCPECGSDLSVNHAIARGRRKTRGVMLAFGICLFLAGLSWTSITSYKAYHKVNWYHYKPTSWLITDAMTEYSVRKQPNLDELIIRLNSGLLSKSQIKSIVEPLLKLHAASINWNDEQFKNLLHDLLELHALTQQQIEQLFKQNYAITFSTRSILRRQRTFHYDTHEAFPNLGSAWKSNEIRFVSDDVSKTIYLNDKLYAQSQSSRKSKYMKSDINSGEGTTQKFDKPFLDEIPDGTAQFKLVIKRTFKLDYPIESEPFDIQMTAVQNVKIVGKNVWVDNFQIQPDKIKPMQNAWLASRVLTEGTRTEVWVRFDSPPVAMSMSAWLIDGEKQEHVGNLYVQAYAADSWYQTKRWASLNLSDKVRIELRPDQSATDTHKMFRTYWGQMMSQDDIKVNAPYVPALNMDQSIAPQLEEAVTITQLKRVKDNSFTFYVTARHPPERITYTISGSWGMRVDAAMDIHSNSNHSYQYIVTIPPDLQTISIKLLPNMNWERFGQLDNLPTGLPMVFENIKVPVKDELIKEVWHGKVILPASTVDE